MPTPSRRATTARRAGHAAGQAGVPPGGLHLPGTRRSSTGSRLGVTPGIVGQIRRGGVVPDVLVASTHSRPPERQGIPSVRWTNPPICLIIGPACADPEHPRPDPVGDVRRPARPRPAPPRRGVGWAGTTGSRRRHADVLAAAVDTTTASSAQGLTVEYDELPETIGRRTTAPGDARPTRPHRVPQAGRAGSRPAGDRWPVVREFVVERDRVAARRARVVTSSRRCSPLPSMVVAHYLGVPDDGRDRFDDWTHAIVSAPVRPARSPTPPPRRPR